MDDPACRLVFEQLRIDDRLELLLTEAEDLLLQRRQVVPSFASTSAVRIGVPLTSAARSETACAEAVAASTESECRHRPPHGYG